MSKLIGEGANSEELREIKLIHHILVAGFFYVKLWHALNSSILNTTQWQ